MTHPWQSKGEKRTIVWSHQPDDETITYLSDMQDVVRYALQVAYKDAIRDERYRLPSPIQLRREVREWFYSRYNYARHHINPVCKAAIAMLRSYKQNHHGNLRIPEVKKLAMRIDTELFKIVDGRIRIALQPNQYVWIPINTANKHYDEYSKCKPSELLITEKKICLTFVVGNGSKPLGSKLIAFDLNFNSMDSTSVRLDDGKAELDTVKTESTRRMVQIQNDFSRRRRMVQKHVMNPQKRMKKLKETRGRQRDRIRDALHKLSTRLVRENPDTSFTFERLTGIRGYGNSKGKRLRTFLNRWPYRIYQSMIENKSPKRTLYVSPRGTSSECPVCGGKSEHPSWAVSRCVKCGVDYDRDRLASLAILLRGLRLCGQPFAVSVYASWPTLKDEYLYTADRPDVGRAGWTKRANAPNGNVNENIPRNGIKLLCRAMWTWA